MSLVWLVVVKSYRLLGFGHYHTTPYLNIWPILVIFTLLNVLFRLYHGNWMYPSLPLSPVEEFRRLTGSILISHTLVMAVLGFAHRSELISRFVLVFSAFLEILLVQAFRDLARFILAKLHVGQIRAVMIGSGAIANKVADAVRDNGYVGFSLVGFFGRAGTEVKGLKRLGDLHDVVKVSRELGVKIALICEDERLFKEQIIDFVSHFQQMDYIPTAKIFPIYGSRPISIEGFGGLEMPNHLRMPIIGRWKGIFDRILATIVFVLVLPLFIVVPILVKLTSKGPVFYRQNRLGKFGRPIRVWKFRTMYADADARLEELLAQNPAIRKEWEETHKIKDDPRVTTLGRILRKSSIDELPQLINVFRGEMALVGPRPIVESEVCHYGDSYRIFSSAKPGITGLWQVSGRSNTDYSRRVLLDVNYVLNWSPWLDLWIVLKSASAVVKMKGAV